MTKAGYKALLKELTDMYIKKGRKKIDNSDYIESYQIYFEHIKRNIKRTENWNSLSRDIKEKYIHELISPYKYKEETLVQLIKYGDNIDEK